MMQGPSACVPVLGLWILPLPQLPLQLPASGLKSCVLQGLQPTKVSAPAAPAASVWERSRHRHPPGQKPILKAATLLPDLLWARGDPSYRICGFQHEAATKAESPFLLGPFLGQHWADLAFSACGGSQGREDGSEGASAPAPSGSAGADGHGPESVSCGSKELGTVGHCRCCLEETQHGIPTQREQNPTLPSWLQDRRTENLEQ